MASAKECDRCGELYKDKALFSNYIVEYKCLNKHTYDLCPSCYKSFDQWFNKYRKKESDKNESASN